MMQSICVHTHVRMAARREQSEWCEYVAAPDEAIRVVVVEVEIAAATSAPELVPRRLAARALYFVRPKEVRACVVLAAHDHDREPGADCANQLAQRAKAKMKKRKTRVTARRMLAVMTAE
jgi:hypothetical protein